MRKLFLFLCFRNGRFPEVGVHGNRDVQERSFSRRRGGERESGSGLFVEINGNGIDGQKTRSVVERSGCFDVFQEFFEIVPGRGKRHRKRKNAVILFVIHARGGEFQIRNKERIQACVVF